MVKFFPKCVKDEDFIKKSVSLIIKSLLYEVSCYPSPGLVSPVSQGAHSDMNYYTFIDSISEISPYFEEIIKIGMSSIPTREILQNIRPIGIKIENKMFSVTKGVNTHKGLIFLISIVSVAVGRIYYDKLPFSSIRDIIKEISNNLVKNELYCKNSRLPKTYGEKIFKKYGIEGVRGEAEKGFPMVFNYSLPFFKKYSYLELNERLCMTLICLMAYCDDSTLLHRHNIEVLYEVKEKSKNILKYIEEGKFQSAKQKIFQLDKEFSNRKISPGGSADLLAITVFLYGIEKYFHI